MTDDFTVRSPRILTSEERKARDALFEATHHGAAALTVSRRPLAGIS